MEGRIGSNDNTFDTVNMPQIPCGHEIFHKPVELLVDEVQWLGSSSQGAIGRAFDKYLEN